MQFTFWIESLLFEIEKLKIILRDFYGVFKILFIDGSPF